MKMKRMAFAATVLLALGLPWAGAQNIVGYDVVTVPAGADMLVSVPFTQPPDIANAVSVVSANPGAKTVTADANTFQGKDYSNGLAILHIARADPGLIDLLRQVAEIPDPAVKKEDSAISFLDDVNRDVRMGVGIRNSELLANSQRHIGFGPVPFYPLVDRGNP